MDTGRRKPVDERLLFVEVCHVLDRLKKVHGKGAARRRSALLRSLFALYRREMRRDGVETPYPLLRLLLPHKELMSGRRNYGLTTASLPRLLTTAFGLSHGSTVPLLQRFNDPNLHPGFAGDFGAVARSIFGPLCRETSTMTVADANLLLDRFSSAFAKYGYMACHGAHVNVMKDIAKVASALELEWLLRVILKDLVINTRDDTILRAYHHQAVTVYNAHSALQPVCIALPFLESRYVPSPMSLFAFVPPMLGQACKNVSFSKMVKVCAHSETREFFLETKYDGMRLQVHWDSDANMVCYTRGGVEWDLDDGLATAFVESLRDSVESVVADCELVGAPNMTGVVRHASLQRKRRRSSSYSANENGSTEMGQSAQCERTTPIIVEEEGEEIVENRDSAMSQRLFVFDMLFYNGRDVMGETLDERRRLLEESVFLEVRESEANVDEVECEASGRRVHLSKLVRARSEKDISQNLNQVIDSSQEGIMVKAPAGVYQPNVRDKSGWFKVKPEYVNGIATDLDLLIIGGNYHTGGRKALSGVLTHFMCGLALTGDHTRFVALCEVRVGLSEAESAILSELLKPHCVEKCPDWIELNNSVLYPNVYVDRPEHSVVLTVRAAEIVRDGAVDFPWRGRRPSNMAKYTLRFPRIQRFRERHDKDWRGAMTLHELQALDATRDGKLLVTVGSSGSFGGDLVSAESSMLDKRRENRPRKRRGVSVESYRMLPDMRGVEQESGIFHDCVVFVVPNMVSLHQLIKQHGGHSAPNMLKSTTHVVAVQVDAKGLDAIGKGVVSVVWHPNWVEDCVAARCLIALHDCNPLRHLVCLSDRLLFTLRDRFDCFFDSYTIDTTVDEVHKRVAAMRPPIPFKYHDKMLEMSVSSPLDLSVVATETNREVVCMLEDDLAQAAGPLAALVLFRRCVVYVDLPESTMVDTTSSSSSLYVVRLALQSRSAELVDSPSAPRLTHIVCDPDNLTRVLMLRSCVSPSVFLVSGNWVRACVASNELLPVASFIV